MKAKTTALCLALALASGIAFAEMNAKERVSVAATSSATSQNSFDQLDRDGDGRISREEAQAGTLPELFLFLDLNHDGGLSRQEFNHRPR